jgi:hypothetical protein
MAPQGAIVSLKVETMNYYSQLISEQVLDNFDYPVLVQLLDQVGYDLRNQVVDQLQDEIQLHRRIGNCLEHLVR